jgi:hypothetical protein
VQHCLGGAMIWTIDLDDFNKICYKEKYPMTKLIGKTLMRMNRKKCSPLEPILDEGLLLKKSNLISIIRINFLLRRCKQNKNK